MDIYPTMCELIGVPVPKGLDAKSQAPVITGQAATVRPFGFTAYRDVQRSIRDDRWKLIRYPQIDKTQLFDLQADPHEMNDLSGKPEHAAKVKELMTQLERSQREFGDTCPLTVADPKPAEWTPPAAGDDSGPAAKAKRPRKRTGGLPAGLH